MESALQQRLLDVDSLSLSPGTACRVAVALPRGYFTGWVNSRSSLSSSIANSRDGTPDFLFLNCTLSSPRIAHLAPANYTRTLLHLRWSAQNTALLGSEVLDPWESRELTLHSMKSTMLAAASQLGIACEDRLAQGHHRDSARTYSRNDTSDSLRVQLAPQPQHGKGGQAPVPEPPFSIAQHPPRAEHLPSGDLHACPWIRFTSRHEALHSSCSLATASEPSPTIQADSDSEAEAVKESTHSKTWTPTTNGSARQATPALRLQRTLVLLSCAHGRVRIAL